MKKIVFVGGVILMIITSLIISGCQNKEASLSDSTEQKDVSDSTEQKEILEVHHSTAEPNYEYQLYLSDDVIFGEVVEELGSEYTNPDRTKDIVNAWQTKYKVRVDKSYKGDLQEGDEIEVITWNRIGLYPEDEEQYQIEDDEAEFYLEKGQSGVFMLSYDEQDGLYDIVFEDEGLFELKETGTSATNEEAKEIYASPSFEITLDQIPDDIKKADVLYGDGADVKDSGVSVG
jgi:hypothetical protein